jgi:hypothetical protein
MLMAMEERTEECIIKFEIASDDQIKAMHALFNRISTEIRIELYRSTDLRDVYYSPYRTFLELEKAWTDDLGNLILLENIPAENVVIYHCSSYVKNFNYKDEEIYIKTIALSKGYDLCLCTGRSSFRYNCSDFIYSDRYFDYAFGERLYWFVCYSSSKDSPELIRDKLIELFGHELGENVLNELQTSKFFNGEN